MRLTTEQHEAIAVEVRAVDPRLKFLTQQYRKEPWGAVFRNAIVLLSVGKHRFVAPVRGGIVTPFDIDDFEQTKRRAVDAAGELRQFAEKRL